MLPNDRRRRSPFAAPRILLPVLAAVLLLGGGAYFFQQRRHQTFLPAPSEPGYRDFVRAFYKGTSALQTGDNTRALLQLTRATQIVPSEAAGFANLGLYYLKAADNEKAAQNLERAGELAPRNGEIALLLSLLRDRQGRVADSIAQMRRAVELNPENNRAAYALAKKIQEGGEANSAVEFQKLVGGILERQPNSLFVLLESARVAARNGDAATFRERIARVAALSAGFSLQSKQILAELQTAGAGPELRRAALRIAGLSNTLSPNPLFKNSKTAVELGDFGTPLFRFANLKSPSPLPAAPDTGLTFTPGTLPGGTNGEVPARVIYLDENTPPLVAVSSNSSVRLIGKTGAGATLPTPGSKPASVLALDWNYDFKNDVVLAGAGGVRIFRQENPARFTDVTNAAGLPAALLSRAYVGAWTVDIEADGDLDIVLGARSGPPVVLRNNGDNTFRALQPFPGANDGLLNFAAADVDGDGDADMAFVDARNRLRVYTNLRSGQFIARPEQETVAPLGAPLAVADLNRDGRLDFATIRPNGDIVRVSEEIEGAGTKAAVIGKTALPATSGDLRLLVGDLDNNGALDLVVTGTAESEVLLGDANNGFAALPARVPARVRDIADLDGDGRLDLVGESASGPMRLLGKGTRAYHYQIVRTRAKDPAEKVAADQRINSFGVNGEVELRAALLVEKQPITGPVLHFGLGENEEADVIRVVWPNGTLRTEFEQKADTVVTSTQTLKGSCPFLFAWNGGSFQFVTDCIWRSPLGLKINAQDTAGVAQTEDWVKIRGDQLAPRNGAYDLRITAELWETHFFDHLGLMGVDHPVGTDVWIDERFAFPQPPLEVIVTRPAQPIAEARDDKNNNLTGVVALRDGRSVDTFARGNYQGVARDHYLEVALPDDAPRNRPLYLIAHGWIHPTDSSINVALGQGKHAPPTGLSLEVPNAAGKWTIARPGLGFPTGKVKTILLRVDDAFKPNAPRRLRLRTNLEIFWDQVTWAERLPAAPVREQRLPLASADLRYRGFSIVQAKNDSSPELPQSYDQLKARTQIWRDLEGFYTRFGNVGPLLARTDDRYVIMNAGDEMRLRFPAPPAPPAGWTRDFVLIGDGWVKDGDYNTAFSKTVLPLPTHAPQKYDVAPTTLENDPVYRKHAADWQNYHTRYVWPHDFANALRDPGEAATRRTQLAPPSFSTHSTHQEARRN